MSATSNGFSIRDYTYKMRSVDVFKCWPFTSATPSNVTRDDIQSWLPPMTKSKSLRSNLNQRNHSSSHQVSTIDDDDNQLQQQQQSESPKSDKSLPPSPSPSPPPAANDDDKLEMLCPVCREFNAATLTAVNAHIDGCLAQTMRDERRHMRITSFKSKSKPPKKRSIAEIFRVEKKQEKEKEKKNEDEEVEEPQIDSVFKLWPSFHNQEEEDPDDDVSFAVNKFRWLSNRLEALRSNRGGGESSKSDGPGEEEEKLEMVCPVCRDFNAATVTAVNAHIDGCLAQAVRDERRQMKRTTKPKAPKKRSIAEILTVAPPIEATKSKLIEVEKDNGRDSSRAASASAAPDTVVSAINSKKSTNKNNKKKKTKQKGKKKSKVEKDGDSDESLNNENKKKKKKKKKKKDKSLFHNELTPKNKEDAYKRKVQTPVYCFRKVKGTVGNKMVSLHDDPSIDKKKLGSKIISVEMKQKVKNCVSVGKHLKEVSPAHGILKKPLKQVSEETSSSYNIQDGSEESYCDDQVPTSDRHVRFAGKDDTLGSKKRDSFENMFNKSSKVLACSLVKEQSSGSDEETASFEANGNYDFIAINIEKRKEVCPIVETKQFSHTLEQVPIQSCLKACTNQEKSKHLEEKSESLTKVAFCDNNNLQQFDGGSTSTLNCCSYDDISRPLSKVQEVQMSGINTDVCESGSFSSIGKFIDHLEHPNFQVAAVNSNANTRTFLEPSSYSDSYHKANERPEFPLQTYGDSDNSGQASGDRQFSHMFSADMIDNSFPFTGWGKGSVRTNYSGPDFFGLPLNSQGELINFSSSGKVGMHQLETPSTSRGSLSGLPVNNILHQSSQENLSINERHVVQKTFPKDGRFPPPHYPARLAVTALQCKEREDIHRPSSDMCSSHYVRPLNSELNLMRNTYIEQNQSERVQNHKGNGIISPKESSDHISLSSSQPTVRLMGKDVPIGRSSKDIQQFVGDVWADEESRRRHYSEFAASENSLLRCSKQDWVSGSPLRISTDNVLQSEKIQIPKASQSSVLVNGPGSEFPLQFIDLHSNRVSQKGSFGVSRNASSYFHPITQEPTSCAAFNGAPGDFRVQFISGAKSLGFSSQSQVLPTSCNFSQPTCLSNGELNDRNKNPHVTKSAFEFPFMQLAVDEQAKTSWFQRPYRSSPSWLSCSTDEKLPVTFSQQFSGASSLSFPQSTWGNNFTTPSENHSTKVLYSSNPLTSLGPRKTPLCPASIVQPVHKVTPTTINSGCRNIAKVADRMKMDDVTTKDHHPCTNTRKRPGAKFDDSRRPIKLPNIEVQENLSRMSRLAGENSSAELQRNTRAAELDPQVDSARSRSCQNEAQNLHPTRYPADSFKLHGTVTPGPVRLGPGAKHILRFS